MISCSRRRMFRFAVAVVLLGCAVMVTASRVSAQYLFGRAGFATGSNPAAVVSADFNGDGKLDLATANYGSNTISILLGNAQGTYGPKTDLATGTGPDSVAVGDFNGDGKPDLVVANGQDNTISILLGNGDGTFQSHVDYATGSAPAFVATGDFNGDGKLDVVVFCEDSSEVSVLPGKGDGTFEAPQNTSVPLSDADGLTTGDFNGDGKLDLALAYPTDAFVQILLGKGDGTFQLGQSFGGVPSLQGASSLVAADFNADGKLDLAVADSFGVPGSVSIGLGNGDGTFQAPVSYAIGNSLAQTVVAADLNGDGKLDLAIAGTNEGVGLVSILLGNGDGTFQTAVAYGAGNTPNAIAVGDYNGDGRPDLAMSDNSTNTVNVLLGNGDGTFGNRFDVASGALARVIADFNGDGKPDLAYSTSSGGSVLLGNGDGTFGPPIDAPLLLGAYSMTTADFNGDGKADLAVLTSGGVSVLLGNGDGTFQAQTFFSVPGLTISAGDFNGDGKPDLAVLEENLGEGSVQIFLNNGNGTFSTAGSAAVATDPTGFTLGDFNGDGKLDVVTTAAHAFLYLNLGNGDGTFQSPITIANVPASNATAADFNGDGKLDLAVTEVNDNDVVGVFLGNGNGTFKPEVDYATGEVPLSATVADVNLDGKPDLIVTNGLMGTSSVSVLLGNGDGTFQTHMEYVSGHQPVSTLTADFNSSGAPDLAVLNFDVPSVTILLNGPALGIFPNNTVGFTSEAVGSTSPSQIITLSDPSVGQLDLTSIVLSGSDFAETTTCGPSLAAGATCTLSVTFTPVATGLRTGSISITDSAPGSPQTISLSGTSGPVLAVSPSNLSFGQQATATTSSPQNVTLTSTGSGPVSITGIATSGAFSETNTCGSTLAAGASCTVSVTFAPSATGTLTGSLVITDDALGSPQTVALTGTATAPSPIVTLSPASLSFAAQEVGTASPTKSVKLTNSGTASLFITNIAASGNFLDISACTRSLEVGASCSIQVIFKPTTAGTLSGSLTISDNAPGSPQSVALSGTAIQPNVALAPESLSFAAELAGQSSIASAVSLTNTGAAPLAISGISFSGTNAGDFSQQNNCGSSVPAGATCTIDVTFKPAAGGSRSAALMVTDNAPGSPQSVALAGTGNDFTLGPLSGSSSSATVTPGQSATYKLSVGSAGNLTGNVSLACTGAPAAATCSVTPGSASVGLGIATAPITVTVTTTASSVSGPRWPKMPPTSSWPPSAWWLAGLASVMAVGTLIRLRRARTTPHGTTISRSALALTLALLLASLAISVPACGGGSTTMTTTQTGTPSGTYTLTVTGTYTAGSAMLQNSTSLSLTVQ